jgi:nucleotide-binding universal stress UspA family protein
VTESKIVVGVDGSAASLGALRVAVEEAWLRHAPLHVVMAWQLTPAAQSSSYQQVTPNRPQRPRTAPRARGRVSAPPVHSKVGCRGT